MLVLLRKVNEGIVIDGGKIVIRVLSIKGRGVRIGIEADKLVHVRREELKPLDSKSSEES